MQGFPRSATDHPKLATPIHRSPDLATHAQCEVQIGVNKLRHENASFRRLERR